jgi:hypothetical protein
MALRNCFVPSRVGAHEELASRLDDYLYLDLQYVKRPVRGSESAG